MIYPLQLSTIARKESDLVGTYGAKAASLAKLKAAGKAVPKAWLLPCRASISHSGVNITRSSIPEDALYSVRSGAPVSMPGLLATKLNVSYGDLYYAVRDVWHSWHGDDARLYREIKEISNTLGTGVIIQQMVPKQVYALTAFTSSQLKPTFAPVVESYKGLGEALVGGEVTGDKVHADTYVWSKKLYKELEKIHVLWGPSDLELAVDEDNKIWWLQWRKLNILNAQEYVAPNGGTILTKGKPIGAPVSVCVPIHQHTVDKPHAIYVTTFSPSNYNKILKADAIVCAVGGETCHAAIVARSLRKPAISGIAANELIFSKPLWIDGVTGNIYTPAKGESVTVNTNVVALPTPCLPDYTLFEKDYKFYSNTLLCRFYSAEELLRVGIISSKRYNAIVDELISVLLTYTYSACLGEFRHFTPAVCDTIASTILIDIAVYGVKCDSNEYYSREAMIEAYLPHIKTLSRAINTMELIDKAFNECRWRGGYGGPKWGAISTHVLQYLRQEIPASIFIDRLFNMEHNGGSIFGKTKLVRNNCPLLYLLDAKRIGWTRLEQVIARMDPPQRTFITQ